MNVTHLLAPNPGPYTGEGTNTYVIEDAGEAVIVDPGPIIDAHAEAIGEAVDALKVVSVIVTHTHVDHAPLANPLASQFLVPALGHSSSAEFSPDERLAEGSELHVGEQTLKVLHTPGHSDDHLCFVSGETMFSGDHIIGGSTVMVTDLSAYMDSLKRLRGVALSRLYPGHGPMIDNPHEVIDYYISHRQEREEQVVAALRGGASSIGAIVEDVYADVDPALHPVAAHSVAAHVGKLVQDGKVGFDETTDLWGSLVRLLV